SAVSADGLYFSTDVPGIYICKSHRKPICLGDFSQHFKAIAQDDQHDTDEKILAHIHRTLKEHNPNMTNYEEMFLDLYFGILETLRLHAQDDHKGAFDKGKEIELNWWSQKMPFYKSEKDVWRALLPIPEMQLYVQDPLAAKETYEPNNNFRVDYGF